MKKVYYIVAKWDEEDVAFFSSIGIEVKACGLKGLHIEDGDKYLKICNYFFERGKHLSRIESFSFKYTKAEITESEYCVIDGYNYCGYPEHEKLTHNVQDCCPKCMHDISQIDDLRVSKVGKYKLWGYFAWTYDVLFAEELFYHEIFEPLGIQCRVVRTKGGRIIDGVVQLVIPEIDEDLEFCHIEQSVCPICWKSKYVDYPESPFYPLHKNPLPHIYLTKERFGSFAASYRKIYISTKLALKLIELKQLKYEWLIPCSNELFKKNCVPVTRPLKFSEDVPKSFYVDDSSKS